MIREDDNLLFGIKREFFFIGLTVSFSAHVILFILASLRMNNIKLEYKNNEPFVVYSVSIEGGKNLGGISQVSKTGKKEPIVPYKKVEEKEAPAPKLEKESEEQIRIKEEAKAKEEKLKQEKEQAEISLREKKKKEEEARKAKELADKKAKEEAAKKEATKKEAERKAKEATEKKAKEEAAKKAAQKNAKPNGVKGGTGTADSAAALDTKLQKALQRYIGESSNAGGVGFGAARITGENGMGGGVVRPPEFFKYKEILEKHIKANWNWFDTSKPYKAQVQMSIDERGNIKKYAIVTSSGDSRYDESVLRAVQKASPVPAPPSSVYEFFKDVRLTLDPQS